MSFYSFFVLFFKTRIVWIFNILKRERLTLVKIFWVNKCWLRTKLSSQYKLYKPTIDAIIKAFSYVDKRRLFSAYFVTQFNNIFHSLLLYQILPLVHIIKTERSLMRAESIELCHVCIAGLPFEGNMSII
jgi:hypothetical protein